MIIDAAFVHASLASPFDDIDATTIAVHTIALLEASHVTPLRLNGSGAELVLSCRVWLDALLFIWASPSPMASSDPRRVVWLELQLVAMKAIEAIFTLPVLDEENCSRHSHCECIPLYVALCSLGSEASTTSAAPAAHGQPFYHWVNAFVSMVEKELHDVAAELQRRIHRPRQDGLLRRMEALAELLTVVVNIAGRHGGLMLPVKLLTSSLLWQNVFRVASSSEDAFIANNDDIPLQLVRACISLLLGWWCRAVELCRSSTPIITVIIDIVKGGDVMRELTRLMCLGKASSAGAVSLQAAHLGAIMVHTWWQQYRMRHKMTAIDPAAASRMASLLRLVGGCAASDQRNGQLSREGRWLHAIHQSWVEATMVAASVVEAHHSDSAECSLCSRSSDKSKSPCGDVFGNFRLMMFVLEQRCDSIQVVLGGQQERQQQQQHLSADATPREHLLKAIASLRDASQHTSSPLTPPAATQQPLLPVDAQIVAAGSLAVHEELAELLQLCRCCFHLGKLNTAAIPQSFLASPLAALSRKLVHLLTLPTSITIACSDSKITSGFCDAVMHYSLTLDADVDRRHSTSSILAATFVGHAAVLIGTSAPIEVVGRCINICSALLQLC